MGTEHDKKKHSLVDIDLLRSMISSAVESSVVKTVNGKLDALKKDIMEEIEAGREEHKLHAERVEPYLKGLEAVQAGKKGIFWITSVIAAVGGAILIIRKIISGGF